MKSLSAIIDWKMKEQATDLDVWLWLQDVLKYLSYDGMSSDESNNDDGLNPMYKVKMLRWRREMGDELRILDAARHTDIAAFHPQGSKPRQRHHRRPVLFSDRPAVQDLPFQMYNESWLKGLHDDKKHYLNLTSPEWKWRDIHCIGRE